MSYNVTTDIAIHHVEDFEVHMKDHGTFATLEITVLTRAPRENELKETAEVTLYFVDVDRARKALSSLLCVNVEDRK